MSSKSLVVMYQVSGSHGNKVSKTTAGTGSVVWKLLASLLEKGWEIQLPSPEEILLTFLSCPSIQSLRNVNYRGKIVIEDRCFLWSRSCK